MGGVPRLNRKELNQVKEQLLERYEKDESPEVCDFFTDEDEYEECSPRQEAERVLEVIESAEQLAKDNERNRLYDRLMPLSYKWPRFTDGKRVHFGEWIKWGNESFQLEDLTFSEDGSIGINNDFECGYEMCIEKGEYLMRGEAPKPPCRDMNGEVIHEGDTVYLANGRPLTVASIEKHPIQGDWFVIEAKETGDHYVSNGLTKKRPDCVDQILEEIESGKLTAASCIKTRLEAIKERKGDDFGY